MMQHYSRNMFICGYSLFQTLGLVAVYILLGVAAMIPVRDRDSEPRWLLKPKAHASCLQRTANSSLEMGTGNVSYILYYISMFNSTCRDPTYTRMPIYYILYIPLISKSHLKHSVSDKDILFRAIPFWSFVINLNVGSVYIFWGVRSWHTCAMIFSATASWRGVASCNAHCIAFGKEKVCKFAHVSM